MITGLPMPLTKFGDPFGFRIIESLDIGSRHEWRRKPKSRAKRIRKKWRKDMRNWRWIERPEFYLIGDATILTSPKGMAILRANAVHVTNLERDPSPHK